MAVDIIPFSQELAQQLVESQEGFPVDFDLAWVWMEYSTKQKCLNKLRSNFEEGLDFIINQKVKVQNEGGRRVSRPHTQIDISVDCFKQLGMMAGTSKGKDIRKHFIECERIAKQSVKPLSPAEILIQQGQLMLALEQRQAALELENQRLRLEQNQIKAEQNLLQETVLQHDAEIGRIFQPDGMLITLAGCLNLFGKSATAAQLSSVGRKAAKIYRDKYGKEPEMIGDARYGKVFAYPQAIAEQVLTEHGYI
jgi:phage anti-repressor protein